MIVTIITIVVITPIEIRDEISVLFEVFSSFMLVVSIIFTTCAI